MNRFANPTTGASGTQNDLRLSAGFVFSFGRNRPQAATPTPVMACSIDSRTADDRPGDAFTMRARVGEANNVPLNYIWTANDGTIEGSLVLKSVGACPGSSRASTQSTCGWTERPRC